MHRLKWTVAEVLVINEVTILKIKRFRKLISLLVLQLLFPAHEVEHQLVNTKLPALETT